MKKILRNILIVLLAVSAAVCTAVGLTACGGTKLLSLKIENAKTDFKVGDEFETGEDFKVYACYSDDSQTDVTAEAQIKQETGMDMNVAGDYQITVSWGGKKEIYTVYVNEFDNILRKIELDTSTVKKTFNLGDDAVFDGLKITCTYENAQGKQIESSTTSLKEFNVEIKSSDNHYVTDVFDRLGNYTVTVSLGVVKASFAVSVDNVQIDTVQGAIFAADAFQENVLTVHQELWEEKKNTNGTVVSYRPTIYDYTFGDNYAYNKETVNSVTAQYQEYVYQTNEFHYSVEDGKIFCVQLQDGVIINNDSAQLNMMNGTPFGIWYNRMTLYGLETTLAYLYKAGKECSNKDLTETANAETREYSFSFTGLVNLANIDDYYQTRVKFTLGDDYTITHAEYEQDFYENPGPGHPAIFETDSSGKTRPTGSVSQKSKVVVDQTTGERTLTNPYSPESTTIKSYKLTYNGKELGDNGVIDCSMASPKLTIVISDITPSTANFTLDDLYFDYEGNFAGEQNSAGLGLYFDGFAASRSGNNIYITLKNGGIWTLKLRTSKTGKTITFNTTGVNPTKMTAQIGNASTGKFSDGSSKSITVGGTVYFRGVVDDYANEGQTATITGANASSASFEESTLGGAKCFKFKATAAGVYVVKVTSTVSSDVQCTFTFTVSEMPDFATLLRGKYTAENWESDFEVTFAPVAATETDVNGTVTVVKTDAEGGASVSETLYYSVDFENASVSLTHTSGTRLGVDFKVDSQKGFVLEDQYGNKNVLVRVEE